jgi:DNA-binding MarR family transcriptional regulator
MATAEQVIAALARAARGAQTYRHLPDGLRRSHLYVLYAIEELGGTARVTDIARQTRVKVPNMTRLLKETEAVGWTTKASDTGDKRAVLVHLTKAGSACLKTYYWDYLAAIAQRLRAEEHPEYDVMIAAIEQAVNAIEEATAEINKADTDPR